MELGRYLVSLLMVTSLTIRTRQLLFISYSNYYITNKQLLAEYRTIKNIQSYPVNSIYVKEVQYIHDGQNILQQRTILPEITEPFQTILNSMHNSNTYTIITNTGSSVMIYSFCGDLMVRTSTVRWELCLACRADSSMTRLTSRLVHDRGRQTPISCDLT